MKKNNSVPAQQRCGNTIYKQQYKYNKTFEDCQLYRVGNEILELIETSATDGTPISKWERRTRESIAERFGKDSIRVIPYFDSVVIVPSHDNYQRFIGSNLNLYNPLPCQPQEGEHTMFDRLMQHIFGDQIEQGWTYFSLAYQKPLQMLPVLCLVSEKNSTGKTTVANCIKWLFGQNVEMMTQTEMNSQFNGWIKGLFAIFEEISDGKRALNIIKALSTAKYATLNEKYKAAISVEVFVKIIILTNNATDFIRANENDIRYWVRELPEIGDNFIPDFDERLRNEVPAILYTLKTRPLPPKRSRMWFTADEIRTEALNNVIENSKSDCAKSILVWAEDAFAEQPITHATIKDLIDILHNRYSHSEIKKALQEELKMTPTTGRYIDYNKNRSVGRFYTFRSSALPDTATDDDDDMPY